MLALVQDAERRGRLADLVAAVEDGELGDDEAQALEEIIELGLSTGRIRGVYGPEGEQAALKTYRKLPRGKELAESTREVTGALAALEGKTLEQVKVQSAGPGAYILSIGVDGLSWRSGSTARAPDSTRSASDDLRIAEPHRREGQELHRRLPGRLHPRDRHMLVIDPTSASTAAPAEPECPRSRRSFRSEALPEKWAPFVRVNAISSRAARRLLRRRSPSRG